MNCPDCNRPIEPNQRFCAACGRKLQPYTPEMEKTAVADPGEPAAPQPWSDTPGGPAAPQPWNVTPGGPDAPQPWSYPPGGPAAPQPWSYPPGGPAASQPPVQPVKKSKAPLIIVLIAVVVLIGGGIVATIIAFGGKKDENPVPQSSMTIPESSKVPREVHVLQDERGTVLVEDDRINTADAAAEQALRDFMSSSTSDPSTDKFTFSYFVSGNALVLQYRYTVDLNSEQIERLKEKAAKQQTDEQIKDYRAIVRLATDVDDPLLVYAYYSVNGEVITVAMVD